MKFHEDGGDGFAEVLVLVGLEVEIFEVEDRLYLDG